MTNDSDSDETQRKRTRDVKMTPEHKAECARLKDLFESITEKKISQAAFASTYGIGTQPNLGHYINGRQPLNRHKALQFAKGLTEISGRRVVIEEFSTRLADEICAMAAYTRMGANMDQGPRVDGPENGSAIMLSADELLLIDHFRRDASGMRLNNFLRYEGVVTPESPVSDTKSEAPSPGGSSALNG